MARLRTAGPMGYIEAPVLCFKGTRETREGLEQDDRVALKLPSGDRISGLGRIEGAGGHSLFQAGPQRGRRGQGLCFQSQGWNGAFIGEAARVEVGQETRPEKKPRRF